MQRISYLPNPMAFVAQFGSLSKVCHQPNSFIGQSLTKLSLLRMTLNFGRSRAQRIKTISKERRMVIRRDEFNHLIDQLNERADTLNALLRNQEIQFQRIAQLQADFDLLKRASVKKA